MEKIKTVNACLCYLCGNSFIIPFKTHDLGKLSLFHLLLDNFKPS